jgi:hypothetical protein
MVNLTKYVNIMLFKGYGCIVGSNASLCSMAVLNSKYLKIIFIGIFYCLKQMFNAYV